MSRVILIDGPPGSGKSSLAEALSALLPNHQLWLEMDPAHPLHPIPVSAMGADFGALRDMEVTDVSNLLLSRWTEFLLRPGAFILESYPFQSHLRVLWQMGACQAVLGSWQEALHQVLAPHDPLLVMQRFAEPEDGFRTVFERRGPEWTEFITTFACNTAFGKDRGLQPPDGGLQFLLDYDRAVADWAKAWPPPKISFEAWSLSAADLAREVARRSGY